MYLFDPDRGRRRRALIRNKASHVNRIATTAAGKLQRDLRNHAVGVLSEVESLFRKEQISDDVLEARVRAKLGRVVSHPRAVEVKAVEGRVILAGPILAAEEHPLIDCVKEVSGVETIESRLEVHETAAEIPALQGGRRREREHFGPFKTVWSPTTRLVAGLAGGALTFYGVKRRGALGSAVGSLGVGVATRALTNIESRRLVGLAKPHGVKVEKSLSAGA
jgi:hypothetical protein